MLKNTVFDTFEDFANAANLKPLPGNWGLTEGSTILKYNQMEDDEGEEVSEGDNLYEDWKEGLKDLQSATYTFRIELVRPLECSLKSISDYLGIGII